MAKKKAAAADVEDDGEKQKNKREFVRGLLAQNPAMSTKDVADALLHKGHTVPDHADKSEKGRQNWATFGVWVSNQRRLSGGAEGAGARRPRGGPGGANGIDLAIAVSLAEAAGGTNNAAAFLEVVNKLDIGAVRKSLAKLAELEEQLGNDGARKAVAVLYGHRAANGDS